MSNTRLGINEDCEITCVIKYICVQVSLFEKPLTYTHSHVAADVSSLSCMGWDLTDISCWTRVCAGTTCTLISATTS